MAGPESLQKILTDCQRWGLPLKQALAFATRAGFSAIEVAEHVGEPSRFEFFGTAESASSFRSSNTALALYRAPSVVDDFYPIGSQAEVWFVATTTTLIEALLEHFDRPRDVATTLGRTQRYQGESSLATLRRLVWNRLKTRFENELRQGTEPGRLFSLLAENEVVASGEPLELVLATAPLRSLLGTPWLDVPGAGRGLLRHHGAVEVLLELYRAEGAMRARSWSPVLFGIELDAAPGIERALEQVQQLAELSRSAPSPLWKRAVLALALWPELGLARVLSQLKTQGLEPGTALLLLIDVLPEASPGALAQSLLDVGYTRPAIFRGLRMVGQGSTRSVEALLSIRTPLEELVLILLADGQTAAELRETFRSLELPLVRLREVLLMHLDRALVDLALPVEDLEPR